MFRKATLVAPAAQAEAPSVPSVVAQAEEVKVVEVVVTTHPNRTSTRPSTNSPTRAEAVAEAEAGAMLVRAGVEKGISGTLEAREAEADGGSKGILFT